MSKNTVIEMSNASPFQDMLTEVLREGARKILQEALEIELEAVLNEYKADRFTDGRQRLVRNGYHRTRKVQTGIGEVDARVPRMRDRYEEGDKVVYQSQILPPYLRRSKSIESLLPWLYLKGISTGDFPEALESLWEEALKGCHNRQSAG